jgi:hypothetical protein
VLCIDREIGLVTVHAQLDHLPVALVQSEVGGQVVVVVEVEEPVLEPDPTARIGGRVAVDPVAQLGEASAQADVLGAVIDAEDAQPVARLHRLAVRVGARGEQVEAQLA